MPHQWTEAELLDLNGEVLQGLRDERPEADESVRYLSQPDTERILFSTAFRRLDGVTQVVLAGEDGHLYHNRLTHSMKVAQLGRRLAEALIDQIERAPGERKGELKELVRRRGGLDPEVVYAAGLAHDLGHPPFGHSGERALQEASEKWKLKDGFEGNAQSFRIVTRLSFRGKPSPGLNLTRATLNAISKYPWLSPDLEAQASAQAGDQSPDPVLVKKGKKFGCYGDDKEQLVRARDGLGLADGERTLEADVMDWADDIAYALHDLEDFYRADLLPLPALARKAEKVFSLLLEKQGEIAALLARRRQIEKRRGTAKLQESAGAELSHINRELRVARADLRTAYVGSGFCRLFREVKTNLWVKTWRQRRIRDVELIAAVKSTVAAFPIDHPYSGSPEDRARLRNYITTLTTRYLTKAIDDGQPVDAVTLGENGLAIQREAYVEVALLKALTRVYVHHDPVLSAQQVGQTDIIRVLFDLYCKALEAGTSDIFPRRVADEAREHARRMSLRNAMARRKSAAGAPLDERAVRFVVDTIASMTEAQAVKCHRRLCGLEFGSVDEGALQ